MVRRLAPQEHGFTLIEAMIALLVLTFGMLALAGMHAAMWRHGDLARQRSEALQLAQHKAEQLRSFASIGAGGAQLAWNGLPASQTETDLRAGADAATTTLGSTVFTRTTTLGGSAADPQRQLRVAVAWTDRAGEMQSVELVSTISRSDPAAAGALALAPVAGGILRWPRGRAIAIPMQAVKLGGDNAGRSALPWAGASGGWLVFDDASGRLLARCALQPDDRSAIDADCSALDAYLLTGSIGGDIVAYAPAGIAFSSMQHVVGAPECVVTDARDPNSLGVIAGYKSYICLIRPSDHDGKPATAPVWSGRTDVSPAPTGRQRVCRYSSRPDVTDNRDHPAVYHLVDETLAHQNFFLASDGVCPLGTQQHEPAPPLG